MTYQKRLEKHLADYKVQRLGIRANGTFTYRGKTRAYGHILPRELKWLNVPEPYRREIREYVAKSKIRPHKFFHHLNSSQAFALAIFHPYLKCAHHVLENTLGAKPIEQWKFEHVPDSVEGTNVDVWWRSSDKTETYCEVKLSEAEFGSTAHDSRHLRKLSGIYHRVLQEYVNDRLLEPVSFFKNYQILRNLWLAARKGHEKDSVLFVLPNANTKPNEQLNEALSQIHISLRTRVQIMHVEVLLDRLATRPAAGDMSWYAIALAEKYLPR
jgi:hypothetical protein